MDPSCLQSKDPVHNPSGLVYNFPPKLTSPSSPNSRYLGCLRISVLSCPLLPRVPSSPQCVFVCLLICFLWNTLLLQDCSQGHFLSGTAPDVTHQPYAQSLPWLHSLQLRLAPAPCPKCPDTTLHGWHTVSWKMPAELAKRPMFIGTRSHLFIYVLSIAPFMLQDRAVYCHRELRAHKAQNIYHLSLDLKKKCAEPGLDSDISQSHSDGFGFALHITHFFYIEMISDTAHRLLRIAVFQNTTCAQFSSLLCKRKGQRNFPRI